MAKSDFFLNFGSNANEFGTKLAGDVKPAIAAVQSLINSLNEYEGSVNKANRGETGNPVSNLFAGLDRATAEFSTLTGTLTSTFDAAMTGVRDLHDDLLALVNEVRQLPTAANKARSELKLVTEEEAAAANKSRQTKPWTPGDLNKIIEDARSARNALKRVADINSTVAGNASKSADALSVLGQKIRELTQITNESSRQVAKGQLGGGNVIVVGGGVANVAGAAGNVDLQQIMAALGAMAPQVRQAAARTDEEATARAGEKGIHPLTAQDLYGPARPGLYSVLGGQPRPVGFDVFPERRDEGGRILQPAESFEHYFRRNDTTRGRLQGIRESLATAAPSKEDLDLFRKFQTTGGSIAQDQFQRLVGGSGIIRSEQVKASFKGVNFGALEPGQIKRLLDGVLERVALAAREQQSIAETGLLQLLREEPRTSFQGGAKGAQAMDYEIHDTLGRALGKIESDIGAGERAFPGAAEGVAFRQEARDTAHALTRIDYRGSENRFGTRGTPGEYRDATISQQRLIGRDVHGDVRTLSARLTETKRLQERAEADFNEAAGVDRDVAALRLQTANANLEAVREEANQRKQANEARKASMQKSGKSPDELRALAVGSQQISALDKQIRELSDETIENTLGAKRGVGRTAPGETQVGLALRRERAQTELDLFQTDPAGYTERRRQRLLTEAEALRHPTNEFGGEGGQAGDPYVAGQIAKDRERLAAQSAEKIGEDLRGAVSGVTDQLRESTQVVQPYTDEQRGEATRRLQAERERLIQEQATTAAKTREHTPGATRLYRGAAGGVIPDWSPEELQGKFAGFSRDRQFQFLKEIGGAGRGILPENVDQVLDQYKRFKSTANWAGYRTGEGDTIFPEGDPRAQRRFRPAQYQGDPYSYLADLMRTRPGLGGPDRYGQSAVAYDETAPDHTRAAAKREALERAVPEHLRSLPEMQEAITNLANGVHSFVSGEHDTLRRGLAGGEVGAVDAPAVEAIRRALAGAPETRSPLFRRAGLRSTLGLSEGEVPRVGETYNVQPSAFGGERGLIEKATFASTNTGQAIYRLAEGARALSVGGVGTPFADEHIFGGKVKVTGVSTDARGRTVVDLEAVDSALRRLGRTASQTAPALRAAVFTPEHAARMTELGKMEATLRPQIAAAKARVLEAGGGDFRAKFDDPGAQAAFDGLVADFNELRAQIAPVNSELHQLRQAAQAAKRETERETATGGAGGGARPPRKPPTPAAGGGGDDGGEEPPGTSPGGAPLRGPRSPRATLANFSALIGQLDQATQAAFDAARNTHGITEQTKTLTNQQRQVLIEAGRAFQADPAYSRFPNQETRVKTFAQALGLPSQRFAQETLSRSGFIAQAADVGGVSREDAHTASVYATALGEVAGESGRVRAALLREAVAQENLNRLRASGTATDLQLLRAEASLASASRSVLSARAADANEPGGTLGKRLFGQRGFIEGQLRHLGQAIENIAGYTLVFSAFQKLQQLVDDGIQADVTFVRLQSSLDAAGRSAGGLRTQLQGVSSATGQYLPDVVNAAAELAGVFHSNADLVEGTRVVAELSNISQHTLNAKEAAVGLRDVTDAYGITGVTQIRAVGDEIARLSQTTGVSVKDVLESTTELAQEAHFLSPHDPRAAQRQAAVLGAFVTRATGETGQAAAEQVSRIVSTLNSGKVQNLLTRTRIPNADGTPGAFLATREQFASGEIGSVLTNLLKNFDKLTPSSQQAIFSLVGAGRQARAFAGLIRDAAAAADELSNAQSDEGALAQQNARYLNTLGGQIKLVGNEFRNLGATLQQLGVFDLIGVLAKSVYGLMKVFNDTFGAIGRILNSNPITSHLEHLIVILGEAALAFKVFGGVAGNILGSAGLRAVARTETVNGVKQSVYDPVTFGGAVQGVRGVPGRIFQGVRGAPGRLLYPSEQAYLSGQYFGAQSAAYTGPLGTSAERFSRQVSARAQRVLINEEGGALTRGLANRGYVGLASGLNTATVAANNFRTSIGFGTGAFDKFRQSTVASIAAMAGLTFVVDEIVGAFSDHHKTVQRVNSLYDDLSGKTDAEAKAKQEGTTTQRTPTEQLAYDTRNPSLRERLGNYFHGDTGNDPNSMTSFGLGAKALTAILPFTGGLIARNFMADHIDTGYSKTMDSLRVLMQHRLELAQGNVSALDKAYKANSKDVVDYAKWIHQMGFNPAQEAQALAELKGIGGKFEGAYENLKLQAAGISEINQLNGVQLQSLSDALGQAQSLTSETLRQYPSLATAILQNSGIPEGTQGYQDLQAAFGIDFERPKLRPGLSPDNAKRLGMDPFTPVKKGGVGKTGYWQRAQAELTAYDHALKQVSIRMAGYSPSELADPNNLNVQADLKLSQSLPQMIQQLRATIRARATQYVALAGLAESFGQNDTAVQDLRRADQVLVHANAAINDKNDPQYIQNLQAIQTNKAKIADLQYQHSLAIIDLAIATTVSPLEKANLAYDRAVRDQQRVAAHPHGGSQAERDAAAQNVAASGLAQQQARYEQAYSRIELQVATFTARGGPLDAVRAARRTMSEAIKKVDDYLNQGGVRGDATFNQLSAQAVQAEKAEFDALVAARLETIKVLVGDTTDPVQMAQNAYRQAIAKLRLDRSFGHGDLRQDRLDLQQAADVRQKARFDQRLGDQQTAYDLHRESAATFLQFLHSQDHMLRTQIRGMKKGQEGYRQRIDELNAIDKAIQDVTNSAQGQFNLGDITLPTVYQVRRQVASGAMVVTNHNDHSVHTVHATINGADFQRVKDYINSILGNKASTSKAPVSGRKVG